MKEYSGFFDIAALMFVMFITSCDGLNSEGIEAKTSPLLLASQLSEVIEIWNSEASVRYAFIFLNSEYVILQGVILGQLGMSSRVQATRLLIQE